MTIDEIKQTIKDLPALLEASIYESHDFQDHVLPLLWALTIEIERLQVAPDHAAEVEEMAREI